MAKPRNNCFISSLVEALTLKKVFNLYVSEKKKPVRVKETDKPDTYKSSGLDKKERIIKASGKNSFYDSVLDEDSLHNFVIKSVLGFIGGILLTYTCFMFFVFSLNFTLKRATLICMGLGVILSLGLAFSVKIRCTVFLCIPQLFSKRGRQALLAYAFILALSGPAKNTLHNVEVMSESLACGQEQIKQAENELVNCVQKPNTIAKKSIEKLLEKINPAVKFYRHFILQLYRTCFDILETFFIGQKWLSSIFLLCKEKLGQPQERCEDLLAESIRNCKSTSNSPNWENLCNINSDEVKRICWTNNNDVCPEIEEVGKVPVARLKERLDKFKQRAMNVLYVQVEGQQTHIQPNRTNSFHEEYQGMATEIRQKTDQFLQYFDFMSVIFGIFILVLFVKVIIYRHKFLTEDHYDNRFITRDFEDIDSTRGEFNMETVLPLTHRERTKYIKVTSIRLIPCEKVRLLSSFIFLIFATFKIIIHMLTDFSLYWILSSVRRDERLLYMNTINEEQPSVSIKVLGDGIVASLLRNVSQAVQRQYSTLDLDPTPCLPDPVPPDYNRYYQIIALVLICWLLALFEPYGLRLRHTVMVTYHPDRARERAIWLYNNILRNRNTYVEVARKEIRRKYRCIPHNPNFRLRLKKKKKSMKCLLCKEKILGDNYYRCSTVNCAGFYCLECFKVLKFCSICQDIKEFEDPSITSEEMDSSDEGLSASDKACKCTKIEKRFKKSKNDKFDYYNNKGYICLKIRKLYFLDEKKCVKKSSHLPLLHQALIYLKNKMPKLKKRIKNISDQESSDWDFDGEISSSANEAESKINAPQEKKADKKFKNVREKKADKTIKSDKEQRAQEKLADFKEKIKDKFKKEEEKIMKYEKKIERDKNNKEKTEEVKADLKIPQEIEENKKTLVKVEDKNITKNTDLKESDETEKNKRALVKIEDKNISKQTDLKESDETEKNKRALVKIEDKNITKQTDLKVSDETEKNKVVVKVEDKNIEEKTDLKTLDGTEKNKDLLTKVENKNIAELQEKEVKIEKDADKKKLENEEEAKESKIKNKAVKIVEKKEKSEDSEQNKMKTEKPESMRECLEKTSDMKSKSEKNKMYVDTIKDRDKYSSVSSTKNLKRVEKQTSISMFKKVRDEVKESLPLKFKIADKIQKKTEETQTQEKSSNIEEEKLPKKMYKIIKKDFQKGLNYKLPKNLPQNKHWHKFIHQNHPTYDLQYQPRYNIQHDSRFEPQNVLHSQLYYGPENQSNYQYSAMSKPQHEHLFESQRQYEFQWQHPCESHYDSLHQHRRPDSQYQPQNHPQYHFQCQNDPEYHQEIFDEKENSEKSSNFQSNQTEMDKTEPEPEKVQSAESLTTNVNEAEGYPLPLEKMIYMNFPELKNVDDYNFPARRSNVQQVECIEIPETEGSECLHGFLNAPKSQCSMPDEDFICIDPQKKFSDCIKPQTSECDYCCSKHMNENLLCSSQTHFCNQNPSDSNFESTASSFVRRTPGCISLDSDGPSRATSVLGLNDMSNIKRSPGNINTDWKRIPDRKSYTFGCSKFQKSCDPCRECGLEVNIPTSRKLEPMNYSKLRSPEPARTPGLLRNPDYEKLNRLKMLEQKLQQESRPSYLKDPSNVRSPRLFRNSNFNPSQPNLRNLGMDENLNLKSGYRPETKPFSEDYPTSDPICPFIRPPLRPKRNAGQVTFAPEPSKSEGFHKIKLESSDDDNFLLKPKRKFLKLSSLSEPDENALEIEKLLMHSFGEKNPKTVSLMKANLAQTYKKNLMEEKDTENEDYRDTSDIDDVENTPDAEVFLSEKEFEKMSQTLLKEKEKKEKAKAQLSWAPDLLSDLPNTSKPKDSHKDC